MTHQMVEALITRGWRQRDRRSPVGIRAALPARYAGVSEMVVESLSAASGLTSPDEKTWFLSAEDYGSAGDAPFRWDAWERLSLEAATGDESWRTEITRFWAGHLPFLFSVRDRYAFIAYSLHSGSVVIGGEPEFEETLSLAPSWDTFVAFLAQAVEPGGTSELSRFLSGGA